MSDDLNASPVNPLPPVVWALALPMIAMEVVVQAGASGLVGGPAAVGWRLDAVQMFALAPEMLRAMWRLGEWPAGVAMRLFTYPFVHATFTHALFVIVILLALGKMVAEVFRWWAVLVVFFGAALGAAGVAALIPGYGIPLVGGYPPVYGLIGAFTFLLWVRLAGSGGRQYRAFSLIGMLLGLQLLFGLLFGGGLGWVPDLAGFASGFGLSFLVAPGGWGAVLARLRRR